ncbi:MAG: hypothetical protein HZB63_09485 [Deltaproteobacteria bacterium]|nr:hypothetical protein [Deltaproteobacteria bacterium]
MLTIFFCPPALADGPDKSLADILSSAESLFKAMQAKNYTSVWAGLSAASRNTIIEETRKEIARNGAGKTASMEEVRRDFAEGGPIARGYWIGFMTHFDPGLVLEQSRWEMGKIAGDRAEILITYKTAEKPALLKLFRENGGWKVGLVETFWGKVRRF